MLSRRGMLAMRIRSAMSIRSAPIRRMVSLDMSPKQKHDMERVKTLLGAVKHSLQSLDLTAEDNHLLESATKQIDLPFLLVVVGEWNSGKSSFINALLGTDICTVGVLPTTSCIHILEWGGENGETVVIKENDQIKHVKIPLPILKNLSLVDTPGTNAILQLHQQITEHFAPRADMVLFVTSVERPFSESERKFMQVLHNWRKKVVVVLNKADLLTGDSLAQVINYVKTHASEVIRESPVVFPVSSRQALSAKQAGGEEVGKDGSGMQVLETYIKQNLTSDEKFVLKLENPVGVAEALLDKYFRVFQHRQGVVGNDLKRVEDLAAHLKLFASDMSAECGARVKAVENIFLRMENESMAFLDRELQLFNTRVLFSPHQLVQEFKTSVNQRATKDLETFLSSFVDWIIAKTQEADKLLFSARSRKGRQPALSLSAGKDRAATHLIGGEAHGGHGHENGKGTQNQLISASQHGQDHAVMRYSQDVGRQLDAIAGEGQGGETTAGFYANRMALIRLLRDEVMKDVTPEQTTKEVDDLTASLRNCMALSTAMEAGSVGLGAFSIAMLFDWTGIAGASVLAIMGAAVVPIRRNQLKKELRSRIKAVSDRVSGEVVRHFDTEITTYRTKVELAIDPWRRDVKVQADKLEEIGVEVATLRSEVADIRTKHTPALPKGKEPSKEIPDSPAPKAIPQ